MFLWVACWAEVEADSHSRWAIGYSSHVLMMFLLKWVSMEVMALRVFVADVDDGGGVAVDVACVDLQQVLVVGVASRAILFNGIIS